MKFEELKKGTWYLFSILPLEHRDGCIKFDDTRKNQSDEPIVVGPTYRKYSDSTMDYEKKYSMHPHWLVRKATRAELKKYKLEYLFNQIENGT